jgi:hypothetical protein
MPRIQETDEVRILRFFEEGPIEKAELLYNIVTQKMRLRLDRPSANRPRREKLLSETANTVPHQEA